MKQLSKLVALLTTVLCFTVLVSITLFAKQQQMYAKSQIKEMACDEIQNAYADVLYRVWIDNPSYVEDVLTECDEWCNLYDLVGDSWINYTFKTLEDSLMYKSNSTGSIVYDPTCINWVYIPDSTYRKLRQVFPDLPTEQARPDKMDTTPIIEMPNE